MLFCIHECLFACGFEIQKEVESAVDLEAATVHVKKSQIAVDTEREPASVDLTMHSETLKDTAPVLEGIKVIFGIKDVFLKRCLKGVS